MNERLGRLISSLSVPLLLAGLLGFAAFFAMLPGVHPDAAIGDHVDEDGIRVLAAREMERLGLAPADFQSRVQLRRHQELIRHLQGHLGSRGLVERMAEGALDPLPIHYRQVRYTRSPDGEGEPELVAEFRFLPDGRLTHVATPNVDRRAEDLEALSSIGIDLDTTGTRRYVVISDGDDDVVPNEVQGERLDPERLARYHLARSAWADLPLTLDSVRVMQMGEEGSIRVVFRADTLLADTRPRLRVDVGMSGGLHGLALEDFRPDGVEREGAMITFSSEDREGPMGAVRAVAQLLIFVTLLILMFRRLDARLVDARSAMRDGLWGGLWALVAVSLVMGYEVLTAAGGGALAIFLSVIISLTTAAGGMLLVFVASAVGDSFAREVWPERLRSLDLLRRFAPVNGTVGKGVIHGIAGAGVVLGINTLALWLPMSLLEVSGSFPATRSALPVVSSLAGSIWFSTYVVLAVVAGIGGALRSRSAIASGIAVVLLLTAVDVAPLAVGPLPVTLILGAVVGAVVAWIFNRFGFVGALMTLAASSAIAKLAPGWLAAPIPDTVDFVLMLLLIAAALVFGFVGIMRREASEDRLPYVPRYVRELSEQQRIERELEIARDVQMSFLPRRMPRIAGVDAAAMCVPAHEVGGDYYDVIVLDQHRIAIMVGDVSGKGIQAAFYMTLVKGVIQSLAAADIPPHEVLVRLNHIFCQNAPRGTFISLVYGVFDSRTGRFAFARAGHNPVLVRKEGSAVFERPSGMAVGLVASDYFSETLREQVVELAPGDVLLLYTDGVSEAMNATHEQFGEERIARVISSNTDRSAAAILEHLRREIEAFTIAEGHFDDMTLIVLRRTDPLELEADTAWQDHVQLSPK